MRQVIVRRFEWREEAPVKMFYRFGPSCPAIYSEMSLADRETPRPMRYAILGVGDEEVDLPAELLPPGTVAGQPIRFENRRKAKLEFLNGL